MYLKGLFRKLINKRITILLGAGAMSEIGGPSTEDITNEVIKEKTFDFINSVIIDYPIIAEIKIHLDKYLKMNSNFEDIMYAIEILISLKKKKNKLIESVFTVLNQRVCYDPALLKMAGRDLLNRICFRIKNFQETVEKDSKNNWFKNFWLNLSKEIKLNIFTLNYDNYLRECIKYDKTTDGFFKTDDIEIYKFQEKKLITSKKHKILNLHGAINYGFNDDLTTIVKFEDINQAIDSWKNRTLSNSQNKREMFYSSIIAGLNKTNKILLNPYSTYLYELKRGIRDNDKLLIIGYSFSDYHINAILNKFKNFHKNPKVVLIDYISKDKREYWNMNPTALGEHEIINQRQLDFIGTFSKHPFQDYYKFNPIINVNKELLIYFNGFKSAADGKYSSEILNHLLKE